MSANLARSNPPETLERGRVEAVLATLAQLRGRGESLAELAHDARNMVTALGLYCDLIEEPGVLSESFRHYSGELRLVAAACRRLVEKMVELDGRGALPQGRASTSRLLAGEPISSLARELNANRNLLAALAGPSIELNLACAGGDRPVRLSSEDLTRILVNLIKNAAEAMPAGGRIGIRLSERPVAAGAAPVLTLTVEDSGPGIPEAQLESVFAAGYTGHGPGHGHRGLGLAITRSIVEAAGGRIEATRREPTGVCFILELPARGG